MNNERLKELGIAPGPWNTDRYPCQIRDATNRITAETRVQNGNIYNPKVHQKNRANARLIKTSPELLDVLFDVLDTYEIQKDFFKYNKLKGVIDGSWLETPNKIKHLIEKIKGE